jgi:hypothetical protein
VFDQNCSECAFNTRTDWQPEQRGSKSWHSLATEERVGPEHVGPDFYRGVRNGLLLVLPFWGAVAWLLFR